MHSEGCAFDLRDRRSLSSLPIHKHSLAFNSIEHHKASKGMDLIVYESLACS